MSKNTKKWMIVPGADHAMSYCVDKARYEVFGIRYTIDGNRFK